MMVTNIIQQVWIHFCLLFTFYVESFVRPQVWKSSFPQIIFSGHLSHETDPASSFTDLCSSQDTKSGRKLLKLTPDLVPPWYCHHNNPYPVAHSGNFSERGGHFQALFFLSNPRLSKQPHGKLSASIKSISLQLICMA